MNWLHEPLSWHEDDTGLVVTADPHTDFWRYTGYGYVRDNAHIYGELRSGEFTFYTRFKANYKNQYDQAGVAVRVDERNWMKSGVELFNERLRFSIVVTVDNSNWSISDLPADFEYLNLEVERTDDSLEVSYSVDDDELDLASIVYLEPRAEVLAGVMCASPEGEGFTTHFSELSLSVPQ